MSVTPSVTSTLGPSPEREAQSLGLTGQGGLEQAGDLRGRERKRQDGRNRTSGTDRSDGRGDSGSGR